MPYIKGDNIRFYSDGVALTLETSCALAATSGTIQTKNKEYLPAGSFPYTFPFVFGIPLFEWKTYTSNKKTWRISSSGNIDWSASENISQKFDDFTMGTIVDVAIGSTDYNVYAGTGILTSWNYSATRSVTSKFSCLVKGIGPLYELGFESFPYTFPFLLS
jgi:hypothetical protein